MGKRNILDELNDSQREAVLYTDGPELVIAGAGSGKTRVLTYKIAYLLYMGMPAERIMALTFTNKAAREMRERISGMVGPQLARRLWMGTFHSIFGRILRQEAEKIGFTPRFTIYDTQDSKSMIKQICKELQLDDKKYKPSMIMSRISAAKNSLITANSYIKDSHIYEDDRRRQMPEIGRIYTIYSERCKQQNAMDFDDMLLYMNILLRDHNDVLEKYQEWFSYILVDEYQDTNLAQYMIIRRLAEKWHRLCVVGDDAQSIYSFRGANIDNILKFEEQQKNCRIFKLERNYRSTKIIVDAANSLIEKNEGQIRKHVYSEEDEGEKITVKELMSDLEEGDYTAKEIKELKKKGSEWRDIAVLYRTNAQSRVIEESMRKTGVPYRIYGGLSFYQRKEIKDALCYMRFVLNEDDEEAMKRIINEPTRGIGETTLNKITACAHINGISVWRVISHPMECGLNVNRGTLSKIMSFASIISPLKEDVEQKSAYEAAEEIMKASGLIEDAVRDTTDGQQRKENLEELLKAIKEYEDQKMEEYGETARLSDFMGEVALATDQDDKEEGDANKVTLMTVHSAKGLEFKHVFIVGLEEQLFPSVMAETQKDMEEERRLLYVAITRAKETCHISYAKQRWKNGKTNITTQSRFIGDIDDKYLNKKIPSSSINNWSWAGNFGSDRIFDEYGINFNPITQRRTNSYHSTTQKQSLQPDTSGLKKVGVRLKTNNENHESQVTQDGIKKGTIVRHRLFGTGTVTDVDSAGNDWRITIEFDNSGKKTLLGRYAKLEIVE